MAVHVLSQQALKKGWIHGVLLVVSAAALTALAAQWRIVLPFTPVPMTGQTFAVLLSGATLGWRLGASSQAVYLAVGALGLPVFSDSTGGIAVFGGPTGGYLIGFVFAAAVIGRLAEHGQDRSLATAFAAFMAGSAVIYVFGVSGLMITTGWSLTEAIASGVVPFLLGDLIKAASAGLLLPGAWALLGDRR